MKPILSLAICIFLFLPSCKKTDPDAQSLSIDNPVGASARQLLSASKYTALKVEVQYMTGFAPDAQALNHFKNYLTTYLNKPGGITVVTKEIGAAGSTTLSVNDIAAIEKQNRTVFTSDSTISLYILYTNGNYTSSNVLGIAYHNTSAALFGKTIHDNSGGIGQASRTKLEATVLEHEVGHLLGLVDVGTAMTVPHKDDAHGNHCSNQSCLMYYASETTDVLGFLITGNVPVFDTACANDLKANGGK